MKLFHVKVKHEDFGSHIYDVAAKDWRVAVDKAVKQAAKDCKNKPAGWRLCYLEEKSDELL